MVAINRTREVFLATELRSADRFFTRLLGLLTTRAQEFVFGHGLWIHPSKGVHMFGMRFAIDAVYVGPDHRIVHIELNLKPWRMGAMRQDAAGVLELPAGAVACTNSQVGDQLVFSQSY